MRIVHQSAADSYSTFPFLVSPQFWLPAPQIAGYLPPPMTDPTEPTDPQAESFTYSSPAFADLTDRQRADLFYAVRALLDVGIEYILGTLNDHAVLTAIMLYRQTIAHEPVKARNPAEFNALMDTPALQFVINVARKRASHSADTSEQDGDHD